MEMILQQKQELSLRMTPELRQAIELLQLSTYDLEQYIREQELENPLIDLQESDGSDNFQESAAVKSSGSGMEQLDWVKQQEESKRDQLINQVNLTFSDCDTQQLLKALIHNLDDNGYLSGDILFQDESKIESGIELLQQIGPPGIGARNLQECLLLQANQCENCPELAEVFIRDYLLLVAEHKWPEIAKGMEISLRSVHELHEYVLTLNPRPCPELTIANTEFMIPDVIVEEKEGQLSFRLNDKGLPKIGLQREYVSNLQGKSELSSYLRDYHKKAQWLLSSIEQRRNTIIRIVTNLIEKQEAFFRKGAESLQPMTLKDIADSIGMHESTVSRAVSNKIMQTPVGSFEMRTLFTSKLSAQDGNSISQSAVKSLLQKLIGKEDKKKPLSDQKIADSFLEEQGITISRRTVSKYREELLIPSSSKRKRVL
ncbi:RNA polymerase factor sigma-54 [Sporosarcina cascadiensis]|uniref:RNA polymerase factor sigma-54 n=1 Tax=Sporosarcina cascadiensis TaxID=2660747 RepID=UPI00129A7D91|nr:RNA polymerase factor sigma-54 [Sporosarcina cascadiensis]